MISAIGLEPILAAQDQYEIDLADYQIALAAYNDLADKEGVTAPVAPTAPATMMVKLNDSIAQLGVEIETNVASQLKQSLVLSA